MRTPALAIANRHPKNLTCKTDHLYAQVADFIYERMKPELYGLLNENELKRASISLATFLEDHFSKTNQMEVFMHWHQQKFKTQLPFYACENTETLMNAQFRFVMWQCVCAEHEEQTFHRQFRTL